MIILFIQLILSDSLGSQDIEDAWVGYIETGIITATLKYFHFKYKLKFLVVSKTN